MVVVLGVVVGPEHDPEVAAGATVGGPEEAGLGPALAGRWVMCRLAIVFLACAVVATDFDASDRSQP